MTSGQRQPDPVPATRHPTADTGVGAAEAWSALKDRALAATAEGVTIAEARTSHRRIIYANEGFVRLTGYTTAESVGRNCRFLQGPETNPATIEAIRAALREHRPCTVEILNYKKSGVPFWNRLSITPLRDDDGEVTHYIGVQSDITEQKQAEADLLRTQRDLERANARMTQNLEQAARVQRTLLPESLPNVQGIRFGWRFRPCHELAGDTLNVVRLDDHHFGLYLIDVSGHGVPAALFSAALGYWLSATPGQSFLFTRDRNNDGPRYRIAPPAQVAERLNRKFPMDPRRAQYFTMLYGVLDVRNYQLRWVAAGHPPPIHVPVDQPPRTLDATGFPVGLVPKPDYEEHTIELATGDRLFGYTDGLVELMNDQEVEFGTERLMAAWDTARDLPLDTAMDTAMARAEAWCQCRELDDDVSILALEVTSESTE